MAKTLLNGVNDVLKRVTILSSDAELGSLTNSAKQSWIDTTVQIWNEVIEEIYSLAGRPMPREMASSSVTLTTGDRDYELAADLVSLNWPLIDETNGRIIDAYPGDFTELRRKQTIPANYTGLPTFGVIRPSDGYLYLDTIPNAAENGLVYTYTYDKDISLTNAADQFPFIDQVYRSLVPAVAERWSQRWKREFAGQLHDKAMASAVRQMTEVPRAVAYGKYA